MRRICAMQCQIEAFEQGGLPTDTPRPSLAHENAILQHPHPFREQQQCTLHREGDNWSSDCKGVACCAHRAVNSTIPIDSWVEVAAERLSLTTSRLSAGGNKYI